MHGWKKAMKINDVSLSTFRSHCGDDRIILILSTPLVSSFRSVRDGMYTKYLWKKLYLILGSIFNSFFRNLHDYSTMNMIHEIFMKLTIHYFCWYYARNTLNLFNFYGICYISLPTFKELRFTNAHTLFSVRNLKKRRITCCCF